MNKISVVGRLGKDSELADVDGGYQVLQFSVASDFGFGEKKTTNWFNCQFWGKRAVKLEEYLKKGQQVVVFGSLKLREYTDKNGVIKLSADINVDDIAFSGQRNEADNSVATTSTKPAPKKEPQGGVFIDEDIPF